MASFTQAGTDLVSVILLPPRKHKTGKYHRKEAEHQALRQECRVTKKTISALQNEHLNFWTQTTQIQGKFPDNS